jgi:hypothetical protein
MRETAVHSLQLLVTFVSWEGYSFRVKLLPDTRSLFRENVMPIAKNQRPTTIDDKHHQRYCALRKAGFNGRDAASSSQFICCCMSNFIVMNLL